MPLPGDLTLPRLGLSPGEFRELAERADVIYHVPLIEVDAAVTEDVLVGRAAEAFGLR